MKLVLQRVKLSGRKDRTGKGCGSNCLHLLPKTQEEEHAYVGNGTDKGEILQVALGSVHIREHCSLQSGHFRIWCGSLLVLQNHALVLCFPKQGPRHKVKLISKIKRCCDIESTRKNWLFYEE